MHRTKLEQRGRAQTQSDERAIDAALETETGAVVLAALQASPYPEIDLTPPRVRLTNVRDLVL